MMNMYNFGRLFSILAFILSAPVMASWDNVDPDEIESMDLTQIRQRHMIRFTVQLAPAKPDAINGMFSNHEKERARRKQAEAARERQRNTGHFYGGWDSSHRDLLPYGSGLRYALSAEVIEERKKALRRFAGVAEIGKAVKIPVTGTNFDKLKVDERSQHIIALPAGVLPFDWLPRDVKLLLVLFLQENNGNSETLDSFAFTCKRNWQLLECLAFRKRVRDEILRVSELNLFPRHDMSPRKQLARYDQIGVYYLYVYPNYTNYARYVEALIPVPDSKETDPKVTNEYSAGYREGSKQGGIDSEPQGAEDMIRAIGEAETRYLGLVAQALLRRGENKMEELSDAPGHFEERLSRIVRGKGKFKNIPFELCRPLIHSINNPAHKLLLRWIETNCDGTYFSNEVWKVVAFTERYSTALSILIGAGALSETHWRSGLKSYCEADPFADDTIYNTQTKIRFLGVAFANGLLRPEMNACEVSNILWYLLTLSALDPNHISLLQEKRFLSDPCGYYNLRHFWRVMGCLYRDAGERFKRVPKQVPEGNVFEGATMELLSTLEGLSSTRPEVLDLIMNYDPFGPYEKYEDGTQTVAILSMWIQFSKNHFDTARFILTNKLHLNFLYHLKRAAERRYRSIAPEEIEGELILMDDLFKKGLLQQSLLPVIRRCLIQGADFLGIFKLSCRYHFINAEVSPVEIHNLPAVFALVAERNNIDRVLYTARVNGFLDDFRDTVGIPEMLAILGSYDEHIYEEALKQITIRGLFAPEMKLVERVPIVKSVCDEVQAAAYPEPSSPLSEKEIALQGELPKVRQAVRPLLRPTLRADEVEEIVAVAHGARMHERNILRFAFEKGFIRDSMYEQVTVKIGDQQFVKTMYLPELLDTIRAMGNLWSYLELARDDDVEGTFQKVCLAIQSVSDQTEPNNDLLCLVVQNIRAYDFPREIPEICERARPILPLTMRAVDKQEVLLQVQKLGILRKIIPEAVGKLVIARMNYKDVYWILKTLIEPEASLSDVDWLIEQIEQHGLSGYDVAMQLRISAQMPDNWEVQEGRVEQLLTSSMSGRDEFHLYRALHKVSKPDELVGVLKGLKAAPCPDAGVYLADCLMSLDSLWKQAETKLKHLKGIQRREGQINKKFMDDLELAKLRKEMTAHDLAYALRAVAGDCTAEWGKK